MSSFATVPGCTSTSDQHPEYATAECDSLVQLVTHDRAGERVLEDLLIDAEQRLAEEGIGGDIYLFKNNTDSAGNSYGCHENFLVVRAGEFSRISDVLLPFLVTRQLICGAGKVLQTPKAATFCLSQRAEHIWEGVSSATTRSRPIINTRDEPHADAEKYRRLHVIVGDSNMAETDHHAQGGYGLAGAGDDRGGGVVPRFRPRQPDTGHSRGQPRSHRSSARAPGRRTSGQCPRDPARVLRPRGRAPRNRDRIRRSTQVVDLWGRTLDAVEAQDFAKVDTEIDWVIKRKLFQRYQDRYSMELSDPKIAQLDLAYHDIKRGRGVFDLLQRKGLAKRITEDEPIDAAVDTPPQTTRAKLRGEFITAAQEAGRDFTVDWVHLKLNDQAQRTVLCKDPFRSVDERVDRLIASM